MDDMEVLQIQDGAGHQLRVRKYQGRLWPDFPPDSIRNMRFLKSRDDDVFVVGYPKSGTHWVWEIVRLLQAGKLDIPDEEKDVGMLEYASLQALEAQPSPRALNTHAHFELMPEDVVKSKTCKLIYFTRDPRDAAVSFFNHHRKLVDFYNYHGEWKNYLPMFISGQVDYESWFAYTRSWEQGMKDHPDLQVYVTTYEALQEAYEEIKAIAKFIDVSADHKFLKEIERITSFDSMKAKKGEREKFKGNGDDAVPIMYRKGKVGDWKNWFTVAQSEQFNEVFEKEMQGTKAYKLYSHESQDPSVPDTNMNER